MSRDRGSETEFEQTLVDRLKLLGYRHQLGTEIERPLDEVVFRDVLRTELARRYADLPPRTLDETVARIARPEGVDPLHRNLHFHRVITRGIEVSFERKVGKRTHVEHRHVHPIDFKNPANNDFRVINQLPITGRNPRRPDVILYVNGLPLVVMELKNPYDEKPTVKHAYNQIQHYTVDIPQLFDFNAVCVISDGNETLHGVHTATMDWYAAWKSIDGLTVEKATTSTTKTLCEGLLRKERLLSYVHDFIAFEVANENITKKGAKYHQYFAVQTAVDRTLSAFRADGDKRVGVIWHTTGSGKSLSMAFLVGILRHHPQLDNPTFVIQVDRADLDSQFFDQFVVVRHLVGAVDRAASVEDLRSLLSNKGDRVIFSTIEKFRLDGDETSHPVLSDASNILVIADEAHRSQYGFTQGYARYLREALPNARRLGFTGTPISFGGADTVEVFGDIIHRYDIEQSQQDRATVPVVYAPRLVRLHLSKTDIDAALKEITGQVEGAEATAIERRKSRWAALARAAGAKDRVAELARDLLGHFLERRKTLRGKAMIVCMTRENCVRLYDALRALPDCPEIKVVMTGDLGTDPKAWSEAGHLTTKTQREAIKARMKAVTDPLQMVIVCDMWLTGTDIPCLHTLYIDKPMRGHNIIQAISRVNRIFNDKPHGMVVDYIGIGDDLRAATALYSKGGGMGQPAPNIEDTARPLFDECLRTVRGLLPAGKDYGGWRKLSNIALEDLIALVYGTLIEGTTHLDDFLAAEARLSSAFLLTKHLDDYMGYADEVLFYQRIRQRCRKGLGVGAPRQEIESAVRDLIDENVESEGVFDIFKAAGLPRADLSILDADFLQTYKDRPHENLRLKLLQRLLHDEINRNQEKNLAQARSFRELLEQTLQRYHSRVIDAATVIQTMLAIQKERTSSSRRANELGLTEEEIAFYDAIAAQYDKVYGVPFLRDLVHDVVQSIKRNLKVDWTAPHREDVKAEVRSAVKRILRTKHKVRPEDLEPFVGHIMKQAESLYRDWPMAA